MFENVMLHLLSDILNSQAENYMIVLICSQLFVFLLTMYIQANTAIIKNI